MIGILMLDTAFPRIVGDVGNAQSFDHPVRYRIVPGATPEAIVRGDQRLWRDAFLDAARALVAEGCTGITTTCGFLTLLRTEMERACAVPIVTSALELVPDLLDAGKRPGILTISASSLSPEHLKAARIPPDIPVQGVDTGHFAAAILGNRTTFDIETAESEMVAGAKQLCRAAPEIDTIVLECTNMPPYRPAIEAATGREIVSILTAIEALRAKTSL